MKLAEALKERSDITERLRQLKNRLIINSRVQKGEAPAEDPEELLAEYDLLSSRLEELIVKINLRNASISDNGETLTSLLAKRDVLTQKISMMRDFLSSASELTMIGSRNEIVIRSTVSVSELQKRTDKLSMELRAIDVRIQSLNWTVELE